MRRAKDEIHASDVTMNQTPLMQTAEYVPYIDELFVVVRFVDPLEIGIRNEFELVTQFALFYRLHIVQLL